MRAFLLFPVVLSLQIVLGGSRILRWRSNTNFDNPENWNVNRLPCSKDRVVFPVRTTGVFIQRNESFLEMVLPENGELVLGEDASISAQSTSSSTTSGGSAEETCDGGEVRFTAVQHRSWFDGYNWCEVAEAGGDCLADQPSRLHTEQIPCASDEVVFPSSSRFLVDMGSGVDIKVAGLSILDQHQTTSSFIRLFESNPEVKKQFLWPRKSSSSTTLNINGVTCHDQTGCECGNSRGRLFDLICERHNCTTPHCENAFMPDGHCCLVCGAMLKLEYSAGFTTRSLENLIQTLIYQFTVGTKAGLNATVSKLVTDQIQVVIADDKIDDDRAIRIGKALRDQLLADMNTKKRYRVTEVTLVTSLGGGPSHGQQTGEESNGHLSSGGIGGIVVALIIFIALFVLALFCFLRRDCRGRPASISKVWGRITHPRGSGGRESMEMQRRVVFDNSMVFDSNLSSFDNPTFGVATPAENYVSMQPPEYSAAFPPENFSKKAPSSLQESGKPGGARPIGLNNNGVGGAEVSKKRGAPSSEKKPKKSRSIPGLPRGHKKLEEESGSDSDEAEVADADLGFGNPLYNTSYLYDDMMNLGQGRLSDDQSGFENPMFLDTQPTLRLQDGAKLGEESEF